MEFLEFAAPGLCPHALRGQCGVGKGSAVQAKSEARKPVRAAMLRRSTSERASCTAQETKSKSPLLLGLVPEPLAAATSGLDASGLVRTRPASGLRSCALGTLGSTRREVAPRPAGRFCTPLRRSGSDSSSAASLLGEVATGSIGDTWAQRGARASHAHGRPGAAEPGRAESEQ